MDDSIRPREAILSNGDLLNKTAMQKNSFAMGTKFLISNHTYSGEEFRITEVIADGGTDFRRMQSLQNDVIIPLASLQAEHARGNLQFLDKSGQVIKG